MKQMIKAGKELVKGVATCGFCHGQKNDPDSILSGGRSNYDLYGEVKASNITSSENGIGDWSTADIITFFRTRTTKDKRTISPEVHRGFEWLSDNDLFSIAVYLKSLPPVNNEVERRNISFLKRNITGFFEGESVVTGSVPSLEKASPSAFGSYIADNVARCSSCHNSPSGVIQNEKYLKGGKKITNEKGSQWSPDITQSQKFGIGSWTENDFLKFFNEGTTPDDRKVNSSFCPVKFYKLASEDHIRALITYLRTVNN